LLVHGGDFIIEFAIRKDFRVFFLGFAKRDGFVVVFENRLERFDMISMSDWRRGGSSFSFVFSFLGIVFFDGSGEDCIRFLFTFTSAWLVSAILAALEAFVEGTIPLDMTVEVAFATLMIPIFRPGSMRRIEAVCVFIPNATRYVKGIFVSKNLLFCGEERKNLPKELSSNNRGFTRSCTGSKDLGCVMSKV